MASLSADEAREVLFLKETAPTVCGDADEVARIRCLVASRYATDPAAARVAADLYERTGDVAGLLPAETMNGGWRGTLHLVPELPVGDARTHLAWVAEATRDYDGFFKRLSEASKEAPRYRWRGIAFRFMRSVGARTPSAYSSGWTIAYNLSGSLNTSATAVRELLFHEIFHSNDQEHGDWAIRALGPTFDAIVARCGTKMSCLAPYAPTETTVRGGTYYAFQPNNGAAVREYAAEIAIRYYREQRAAQDDQPGPKPFKCGPKENLLSWNLVKGEFFAGIDRTPPCR